MNKGVDDYLRQVTFHFCIVIFFLLQGGCNPSAEHDKEVTKIDFEGEAISFLGDTLVRPKEDENTFLEKDSLLREAFIIYSGDSTDLNNIIWYGRRLSYLHRYKDAISIFTRGIQYHPNAPELYRHRGHRYITIRQLDLAIEDLKQGIELARNRPVEMEPDGIPNKLDIPLSNLQFNLYYHLGLAYYLKADYPKAIRTYQEGMKYADNPDLKVAMTDWLYLACRRSGDASCAEGLLNDIHADMEIIENEGYLQRLLVYKGETKAESLSSPGMDPLQYATQNYGLSAWYDLNSLKSEAAGIRHLILSSGFWPAFGYIAAEADSSRLRMQ